MVANVWKYSNEMPKDRQASLLKISSSQKMIDLVARGNNIISYWIEESKTFNGYIRHNFKLAVAPELFDQFYNGVEGIRAQYLKSAEIGDQQNISYIDAIKDDLISYHITHRTVRPLADTQTLENSLGLEGSKIWISQKDSTLDEQDYKTLKNVEILVQNWIKYANRAAYLVASGRSQKNRISKYKPILGVRAPVGTALIIHSAWVNNSGQTLIPKGKRTRAKQIHYFGFS